MYQLYASFFRMQRDLKRLTLHHTDKRKDILEVAHFPPHFDSISSISVCVSGCIGLILDKAVQ